MFTEITRLAVEHEAINLGQGFPDFDGPRFAIDAVAEAMAAGHNQYARPFGVLPLVEAIADWQAAGGRARPDPMSEVTVTSGCTEALCCCMLGLLEPGDEVVVFDPVYDAYPAGAALADATLRRVPLREPRGLDDPFWFDEAELRAAFGPKTRAILVNTPHNPTGKVFSNDELVLIASLAQAHDAFVIADEVYERLVYEPAAHHSVASVPGLEDRTITCSSLGKTFSFTGWKIGWAVAPAHLTAGIRAAHQYTVFCSATPLQHAAAVALRTGGEAVRQLAKDYKRRRDLLVEGLRRLDLRAYRPEAGYFVMAEHAHLGLGDDVTLTKRLIQELGVAVIPPTAFYADRALGERLLRFAFCKRDEVIEAALERLAGIGTLSR